MLKIKRLFRRLRYVFMLRSLSWKYESCRDCGHCFRLVWSVKDGIWNEVMGNGDGILCLDCFIERADMKGIYLKKEYFDIEIFIPSNNLLI
jgi:hypothetical protein